MPASFITRLKRLIPESDWSRVIRALRQDSRVWNTLQENSVAQQAIEICGSHPDLWTPAQLACVLIGVPHLPQRLQQSAEEELEKKIRHQAAASLEHLLDTNPVDPQTLPAIGLAALALRERWRLLDYSSEILAVFEPIDPQFLDTIFACLVGIVPNPDILFNVCLGPHSNPRFQQHAIHGLMANPLPTNTKSNLLENALLQVPDLRRLELLREINQEDPSLGQVVAGNLLQVLESAAASKENKFEQVQYLLEKSELLQISGAYHQAMPLLDEAWQTSVRLQADLTAQLAQAAAKGHDPDTALHAIEKINKIDTHLHASQPEVTLAHIHTGNLESAGIFDSQTSLIEPVSPATLLASAKLALQENDPSKAQLIAQQALEVSLHLKRAKHYHAESLTEQTTVTPDFLLSLAETLLSLELPVEACRAAELSLAILPNDSHTLKILSQANLKIGESAKALEFAHTAAALDPSSAELRQNLVSVLVQNHEWDQARAELESLIHRTPNPSAEDLTTLASCYLHIGQPKQAAQTCQKALSADPQNGLAHSTLGEAFRLLGDLKSAYRHFNQAIVSAPQLLIPWLALAELHQEKGELDQAKQRLLAAAQAIPQNPAVHFALAKTHLAERSQTKALAEFQQAAEFIHIHPDAALDQEISSYLGQTLIDLGYTAEALSTLQSAHQSHPSNPHIAHLYGKALLKSGETGPALSALAIAIQADSTNPQILLDYGLAHLELGHHPEEALRAIQAALDLDPDAPRGAALLAEAYAQSKQYENALAAYQKAFAASLVQDPRWHVRLAAGFANTAFALDEPELAITKLQEAIQVAPDDLHLFQILSQAYQLADLRQNALKVILDVFSRGENNLEILLWVSDQAVGLNELDLALDALHQASQLAPNKAEILVRMGYIYLERDQPDEARQTFGQLFSTENVATNDLRMAAQALIGLGDLSNSIPYLERALEISNYQSTDLLQELTDIHIQAGNYQSALNAIEQHIELSPGNPLLLVAKAEILEKLGKSNAAAAALLEALDITPQDAELNYRAAITLRKCGDLSASLEHIEKAIHLNPTDPQILSLAVEINRACLLFDRAKSLIAAQIQPETPTPKWAFWQAEAHLEKGDLKLAGKTLQALENIANNHPYMLALQTRFHHRKGQFHTAQKSLEQTLLYLGSFDLNELEPHDRASVLLAVAEASLELGFWGVALYLARQAAAESPNEPGPYLCQAKVYGQRSEFQYVCQAVQARKVAPGQIAFNAYAREAFDRSIQLALKRSPAPQSIAEVHHWRTRGAFAIHNLPVKEAADFAPKTSSDVAAVIAAHRRETQIYEPNQIPKAYRTSPEVLFQLALSFANSDPDRAVQLALKGIESQPNNPLANALHALLAQRTGDAPAALASINQALTLQAYEPRWHALAAHLQRELGHYSAAIANLEQASQLEDDHAPHFYDLGKLYLEDNSPGNAIRALEQATRLVSSDSSYWSALLEAYRMVDDLDQAARCAQQLIKLNPANAGPELLAAQIAVEADRKPEALQYVRQAVKLGLENSESIRQAAGLLMHLDQTDQAMQLLEDAISRAASPLPLLLERAKLVKVTSGSKAKLQSLKSLAKEFPNDPSILAAMVTAFVETKQFKEAILTAQQAIKYADDTLDRSEKARLHFQLGSLLRAGGQLDQAVHHLGEAIRLAPRLLDSYLEISAAYQQRRDYENALEFYKRAIEIAPANPNPYREAGLLLKECKDYIAAEAMLRRAASLAPKDLNVQRQLGAVIALTLVHQTEPNQVEPNEINQ